MNKTNYFKVGLFVLAAAATLVVTLIVLGAGFLETEKVYFETYFDESVQGLSSGSTVHYRGFPIGKVEHIGLIQQEYDFLDKPELTRKYKKYVMVVFSVDDKQFIGNGEKVIRDFLLHFVEDGGRIRMTQQPLTGLAFIDIDYLDPDMYPTMSIEWKPKYIYIPSAPSILSTFTQTAEEAFRQMAEIDIAELTRNADKMVLAITDALESAKVAQISGNLNSLITELRQTNAGLKNMLAVADANAAGANIPQTIAKLNNAIDNANNILFSNSADIYIVMDNLKTISENIKQLTSQLKQHPSSLIFSQTPQTPEVIK